MGKKHGWKNILASVLFVSMLASGIAVGAPAENTAAAEQDNWGKIQDIVGRYYGEWKDTSYPGQTSSLMPDTALAGNGDVGINSGGNAKEKTFYVSKGDFWEYNGSPKQLGGYTIRQKSEERANYAYGKSVTASSVWQGTSADILTDGDESTVWTTSAYDHNGEHWAVVDLEETKMIGYWVVKNRGAGYPDEISVNTSDFRLEYSDDGKAWTSFAEIRGNTESIVTGVLAEPVNARYVRIYITKGEQNANTYARVAELELYEDESAAAGTENFALGYSSVESSSEDTFGDTIHFGAERAVDGSFQQRYEGWGWCTYPINQSTQEPQWLQINFDEEQKLVRYRLFNDGAARDIAQSCNSYDFQLQYRNSDLEEWKTADNVVGNTENICDRILDEPVKAKQFRIYITDPVQPEYDRTTDVRAKIANLELYSSAVISDDTETETTFYEKQDILNARILTDMGLAGEQVSMETFTAATENVIVTKLETSGNEPLELEVETWVRSDDSNRPAEVTVNEDGSMTAARSTYNSNPSDPNSHTSKAALTTGIIGAEAEAKAGNGSTMLTFMLNPGEKVWIVTAVAGGGQTYDNTGKLTGKDPVQESAALLKEYSDSDAVAALLENHQNWWKDYWSASYIDFGTEDEQLNTVQKYYYGAQYIFGSSVREGKTAPSMMGIWTTTDAPSWNAHYQLNYNHNASYYGAGSSNRPEYSKPAFDVILDYQEQAKKNAESVAELQKLDWVDAYWVAPGGDTGYVDKRIAEGTIDQEKGIEGGVLYPAGIIPFGQSACPGLYHNQTANAAFSALAGVEYYKYTLDEEYLRDYLYDYLKACAAFYEQWMEKDENGQYNIYAGFHEQSWGLNPTVELLTVNFLFETLIDASETLGVDEDKRELWTDILENLAPIPTHDYNGKEVIIMAEAKWNGGDEYAYDPYLLKTDGNISHLDAVCLDGEVGYFGDPGTLELLRNTLDVSDAAWGHGNHFTRVYPIAVRSRYDINKIIDLFTETVNANMQANLRVKDAYHGLEKCANIMTINEMMIIADEGIVKLFPNWYEDKDAKFVNLRAKGAFVVSAEYDGDAQEAVNVTVTSEAGEDMTLVSPWAEGMTVRDSDGNIVGKEKGTAPKWEDQENATYTFATEAGETYTIEKGEPDPVNLDTLKELLADAKEHVSSGDVDKCIEAVQKLFDKAIAEAEAVIAKGGAATAEEVDNAEDLVSLALHSLSFTAPDKAALKEAIDLGGRYDLDKYVEDGKAEFTEALETAKEVYGNGNALQEEVTKAWQDLVNAIAELRLKADKTNLEELLKAVEGLDLSVYTDESVAVYKTALAAAQDVMDDESLSIYEQKTVDDAVAELQAAKDGLTEKSGSGSGDEGDGGDNTGDDSEGSGGQQSGGSDSGSQSGADSGSSSGSGTDAPKTGDATVPFGLMAAAVLAGVAAAGTAAYRRKRR